MQPQLSYLICATPRTGSTLLCESLMNTGLAGYPEEYFSPDAEDTFHRSLGVSTFKPFLEKVLEEKTTPNGVFGAKVKMPEFFPYFIRKLKETDAEAESLSDADLLSQTFPNLHYVWITRRSKVRQAVSLLKAIQTSVWKTRSVKPQKTPQEPLQYVFDGIDLLVQRIVTHEAIWQEFFDRYDIRPFMVVYEDFVNDYEGTARRILDYLGVRVTGDLRGGQRVLMRQADGLSDEWVERYLREKSELMMKA